MAIDRDRWMRHGRHGGVRYVGVSRGPAGEVRQDSEEQGNAGRVEVRQAWNEVEGSGTEGTEREGTEMQARSV